MFADKELERRGASVDLDLFVAELGALLHDKTFLRVLEEDESLSALRRVRMRERAEMLKDARKNATKKDREQIRQSITFQLFVKELDSSPKGMRSLYEKYLKEQTGKKTTKDRSAFVRSRKHEESFINCVRGMLNQ